MTGLERTPALEHACYRLFLSQQRSEPARRAVIAILDRRLEQADRSSAPVRRRLPRALLDRLIDTSEGRDQVLADLAREVRFRYFDEPLIEAARQETYAEMERHLDALVADPGARRPRPADRRSS